MLGVGQRRQQELVPEVETPERLPAPSVLVDGPIDPSRGLLGSPRLSTEQCVPPHRTARRGGARHRDGRRGDEEGGPPDGGPPSPPSFLPAPRRRGRAGDGGGPRR